MKFDELNWIINLIPDAVLLISRKQIITLANPKAADLFGTTIEKLVGQPLDNLVPYPARPNHHQYVEGFFSHPKPRPMGSGMTFYGQREDESIFPIDIMINRFPIAGKDYAIGIIRDASERVAVQEINETLAVINARFARTQDVGGLGWWEVDQHQNQMTWSAIVSQLLGVSETVVPSFQVISDLCVTEDKERLDALRNSLGVLSEQRISYRIRRPDGDVRWIEEVISQEPDQRVLGIMRDVTEQKQLEQKLRAESVTDPLTGLFNRRQFKRDLKAVHAKFIRSGTRYIVIDCDFDHFKTINDRYGHAMGDEVLKKSAVLLKQQLRTYDSAYRVGGEEFTILLSDLSTSDAERLAERIRQSIETSCFELDDFSVRASISLGVTQCRQSDNTFDDVLRRADEALYQSKARSRNTITLIK